MYSRCHVGNPCPSCANSIFALVMLCWCLLQHSSAFTRTSHSCWRCERVLSGRGWTQRFCWPLHCIVSKSPHNCLCSAWTCWCTWCIDPSRRLTTWENFCESGFFFLRTVIVVVAKLILVAVISSKVLIAFAHFVVKSKRSVMALVVFLERLVMTELEGPITNDHFLSCTSVSTATAWCTKAFWDWTTLLVFQIRQKCTNSRELTFSLG